ncbi:MAG: DNA-binding response regulator [Nitrospinae bacterium CG11_big_fil_rev_8_21_14_0_20_56_8]|nr:MAG: DNA-binding response regulator [Nitrospinae bacterium CG11_big_fil_rev_8_21_14_0_20_56_8]
MAGQKILVVEDEESLQELVEFNLKKEAYRVTSVGCGEDALRQAKVLNPDLVVLDLMLPGLDGLEVCRRLKKDPATEHIPVMMLTAKGEESDIVIGLELGAEDYVTKPFSLKVFLSRVKAILRRNSPEGSVDPEMLVFPGLVIHPGRHQVFVEDIPATLTFSEFRILQVLAGRPGWVFTRSQIVDAIRGDDYAVTDRSVDFQIVGLRKKLGNMAKYIETVRGVGYRFAEASEE